ncbi:hypothetical protein PCL_09029 [Purpureocillium lilacinum]|uniref:Uncharacterized protein n=1 Tax=Purpureocillium lilacinum TaxID=33203 RepID=A0A2U3EGZ0_PURLI|nr:hypothetical protein Purlil1_11772 [Purpureocillium lilacinum]PWI73753.1 hypothetical protein PCL_09029 [Purpureocillium lilacinum]
MATQPQGPSRAHDHDARARPRSRTNPQLTRRASIAPDAAVPPGDPSARPRARQPFGFGNAPVRPQGGRPTEELEAGR